MSSQPLTVQRDYMRIRPIRDGVVIDHLLQYTGLFILNFLDHPDLTITAGKNYPSTGLTDLAEELTGERPEETIQKDIIYMEGGTLTEDQRAGIFIVSPTASITYIEGGKVVRKERSKKRYDGDDCVEIGTPERVGGVLLCANNDCTTNKEGGKREFDIIETPSIEDVLRYTTTFQEHTPIRVQCGYCEQEFYGPQVRFYTGQTLRDVLDGKGRFVQDLGHIL